MRAADLAARLALQAESVVRKLLPRGHKHGHEWQHGVLEDGLGSALVVSLVGASAGSWSDSSTGQAGDLIDLWMSTQQVSLREACAQATSHLGIRNYRPRHVRKSYPKPGRDGAQRPSDEHAAWLRDAKKLPDATIAAYRVASKGEALMFPALRPDPKANSGFDLVAASFCLPGGPLTRESGFEPVLFGWQAVPAQSRMIVICADELDACAWHAYGYPALSVPAGDDRGRWIETEFVELEIFDAVYLSFPEDHPLHDRLPEYIERLGRERCRVVALPKPKSAACLEAGIPDSAVAQAMRKSRTLDPVELRNVREFEDAVVSEIGRVDTGLVLPWPKTKARLKLRPAELSIWPGINGHGKTTVVSQVIGYEAACGVRCCVASMEWPTARWLLRMQRQIGAVKLPTADYSRKLTRILSESLWTFDVAGSAKGARILEVFWYAWRRYGIELFCIDNLTKCGFADDDNAGQKQFVEALSDFARETRTHVMLVAHMRKGADEDEPCGKMGVKGSGGITDMAQTVVEVWRNKAREKALDAANRKEFPVPLPEKFAEGGARGYDTLLLVHKQNETGDEPTFQLWFDERTGCYLNGPHDVPKAMLPLVPDVESSPVAEAA